MDLLFKKEKTEKGALKKNQAETHRSSDMYAVTRSPWLDLSLRPSLLPEDCEQHLTCLAYLEARDICSAGRFLFLASVCGGPEQSRSPRKLLRMERGFRPSWKVSQGPHSSAARAMRTGIDGDICGLGSRWVGTPRETQGDQFG